MNELKDYLISQLTVIPQIVYEGLLAFFCVGTVVLIILYRRKVYRYIGWLLLFEYVFFVYGLTVFFRRTGLIKIYYSPFWSYVSIFRKGDLKALYETILNVVLFIPLGFLWGIISYKWSKSWKWFSVLIVGLGLSVIIELLQYYFKKGCVEVDDVIHNTFGCLMGFLIWRGVSKMYTAIKTQSA